MKDLTKIEKPFGLLGKKTREALETHGGPYQYFDRGKWRDCHCSGALVVRDSLTVYRVKPAANPITSMTPVDTGSLRRHWLAIAKSAAIGRTVDRPDMRGKIAGFTGGDRDAREVVLAYSTQDEINAALRHWQATRTENGSDYAALKRLIALRVPS
jgi:hypothetical protein